MSTFINLPKHNRILCIIVACRLSLLGIHAQDIERQLTLVRPYEPSVSDAQKITALPNLRDTFSIKPSFNYSIKSRRIDTRFDVTPITPARLQPLPQTKLYHGYIKVGASSIPGVMSEVAFNTLRNKDYAVGALVKYDRAGGKVKLANDEKEFAGFSDISAKGFGKKFFHNNSILYGELGASGQTVYNYGYQAIDSIGVKPSPEFEKADIRKRYIFADANVGLRSSHFKTEEMNYDMKLDYKFSNNKFEEKIYNEHAINFKTQIDNNMFGGNLNLDVFNRSMDFDTLYNNFAFDLNPWFMLDNDSVRFQVGMRVAAYKQGEGDLQYGIFPKIEFQFTLLKDIFIPFVGIDGYLSPNTYRNMVIENPFVAPGLAVPISKTKLLIYAGLKGTITSKLSYYLRGNFATSENDYFFVNDTTFTRYQNYFTVVADNMNTLNIKGELYFNPVENVDLGIKANYFRYETTNEKYAWHRPNFTLEFKAKYNHRNKIIANFDIMGIGKRYAKKFDASDLENDFYLLNSVVSFHLGAEYRYTKSLSFFLKLNNLTGAHYERWNFYPSHRFHIMGGFTYSL